MKATQTAKPPFYIVGLPSEPLEAAEAEMKFGRLCTELAKAFPYVEEMRAVVKSKKQVGAHARYEVSVDVYTPRQTYAFSEAGYNLASVFDALGPRMKRLMGSKQSRVTGSHGDSARKVNIRGVG